MATHWITQRPAAVLGVLVLVALCFGSEATTCSSISNPAFEIPKNGQGAYFCSVDSANFGIITQLGFSTKTRRYYVTISEDLYTTATDLSSITSMAQLTLVNTFAPAPYGAGAWGNYPSAPAWSADLFLINTLTTHPDPDVDHIGYSSPGSWADNYFYSLWVSSTGATNASEPLQLLSENSLTISDYPPTIRAMLATYDPTWNVSWWFTSNWGITTTPTAPKRVLRPSITWVNHATGVISNYTYPISYFPQYGGFTAFVPNRQLLFYPVGSRLYYTPRSNHPFGPTGFQPGSVSYVTIPGFNIFSILHLPESDSLLLGCSSSSILELDLSTMTIVRSNRYNTVPDSPNFSSQWISSLFRDPKHPRLVWAMSLWAQPFFLSIDLEDRDDAAIYGTNNQLLLSGPPPKYFNPGRNWVPSLDDKFFYQPGSAVLYTAAGNSGMELIASADAVYYGTSATLRPGYFSFKTHDCAVHSTCQECQQDPDYCGWCSASSTCVDSASACTGTWNKTYVCPVSTFALPQNLPPAGGVNVTLYGSVMKSGLVCRFMQPPSTFIGAPVPARLVSPTSVSCTVNSAESLMDTSPTLAAQVQLMDGSSNWGVAYDVTYLSCASHTTCASCIDTSPCGWCLNTDSCTHESTCLQTTSNVWDRQCPAIGTISPMAASVLGGSTISFAMTNLLQDPSFTYQVKFGTYGSVDAAFQSTARRAITNTLTAVSPAMPGASGTIPIDIIRNPGARLVASTSTTSFSAYDCSASTTCATCFSAGSTCNWCVSTHTCVDTSVTTTCSSDPAACAALVSIGPNVTFLGETPALALTGINLDSLPATGMQCVFTGASLLSTPATATSATAATCSSPSGATVGFYALALGYNQVPVTQSIPYEIYDCSAFPCSTCIAPGKESKCQWCGDFPSTVTCQPAGTTCSGGATQLVASCPAITSAVPNLISKDAPTAVTLTGAFGNMDASVQCFFKLDATTLNAAVTSPSPTSVACNSVTLTVAGNWDVSIHTGSNAYTPEHPITVFSCTSQTSCASCTSFSGVCGWGSGGCNAAGGDLITNAGNCPAVTSVVPNVALRSGGDSISIFGGPFTSGSYTCKFTTTIGTFSTTSTTSSSTSYVTCPTPTVSRSTMATVTLETTSGGVAYGTGSPLSFTFVDCPTFSSSLCSDTCVSFPDASGNILQGCGFCTTTGLCTTPSRCNDMWVPECFNSIDVYPSFALLDGQDVLKISVDHEPLLPLGQTVLPMDFTCSFGSRVMPAMMTFANNDSTISCSPPSNVPVSTVDFSVNYRNKPFTSVTAFRFADCTRATDCSSCLAMPPCGWCLDTQACTTPSRCPLGNYTSSACPDLRSLSP